MQRDARGGMLMIGVVSLISFSGLVVVAVSSQSGGARSVYASVLTGRRLTAMAESAVAEAQAELAGALGKAGISSAESSWRVTPTRTRMLAAREYAGMTVSDVRVKRLPYDPTKNGGEVELSATATSSSLLGRKLIRTVTQRHFTSLSPDKKTFEIAEVPHRCRVDCEGGE